MGALKHVIQINGGTRRGHLRGDLYNGNSIVLQKQEKFVVSPIVNRTPS